MGNIVVKDYKGDGELDYIVMFIFTIDTSTRDLAQLLERDWKLSAQIAPM